MKVTNDGRDGSLSIKSAFQKIFKSQSRCIKLLSFMVTDMRMLKDMKNYLLANPSNKIHCILDASQITTYPSKTLLRALVKLVKCFNGRLQTKIRAGDGKTCGSLHNKDIIAADYSGKQFLYLSTSANITKNGYNHINAGTLVWTQSPVDNAEESFDIEWNHPVCYLFICCATSTTNKSPFAPSL